MNELESKSNAQRAQGGLGLLSHTISVQKSQESILLILERRDGAERQGEERGGSAREEVVQLVLSWLAQEREEKGEGYLRCPRRGPKYPRLKLDTKTPVGTKTGNMYTISSDGGVSFFDSKPSPRCRHVDEDQVRGFGRF